MAKSVAADLRRFEAYSFCKAHALAVIAVAWQEACLGYRVFEAAAAPSLENDRLALDTVHNGSYG